MQGQGSAYATSRRRSELPRPTLRPAATRATPSQIRTGLTRRPAPPDSLRQGPALCCVVLRWPIIFLKIIEKTFDSMFLYLQSLDVIPLPINLIRQASNLLPCIIISYNRII